MALSLAVMLSACSGLSTRGESNQVEFLTQALAAEAPAREELWRSSPSANGSMQSRLRRALLQSVPGHSGYDLAAAEASLQALLDSDPPADLAAVARLRLAELRTELKSAGECRQEVITLKQRLARVVEIERKLNSNGH